MLYGLGSSRNAIFSESSIIEGVECVQDHASLSKPRERRQFEPLRMPFAVPDQEAPTVESDAIETVNI